ncbi:hypothetical protein [Mangrovibacterium diazotrophicum]|uniref:hypothetical protein n=1 Tax=Mangrovibacterium diazotrophicum TaxID=1261403 RepID=UPI000E7388AF|nr:hypothetical protein [Mangrovibacterium diazotrophicum]
MSFSSKAILLVCLAIFSCLSSCHSSTKKEAISPQQQQTATSDDYEVYLPEDNQPKNGWPLLIAIDPHGSGITAMQHLQQAAEQYPAIIIASNRIQNNDPNFMAELDKLITDARKRYPVSDRIYLAGFSGGARMALAYAGSHRVSGVIAAGAFAQPDELRTIPCPVIGILGMDDFNFSEAAQYLFNPELLPVNVHIELTHASHEWPGADRLTDAWGWFQLSNESNKDKLTNYVERQQQRIDSLMLTGDLLQAACSSRNMASVPAFEALVPFSKNTNELTGSTAYQQQLEALGKSLQFEMNTRQELSQALIEKDALWWTNEISVLQKKAETEPDVIQQMAYKRLTGFLGIVCYSYSRQFVARGDAAQLEQVLMVYRLAEPNNPDVLRFTEELKKLQQP